ncbi:MAG TPA: hypothetical protein DD435_02945, partial [Cyanobacteria bacterium UBA8530]|nr:hypothetical protein [Cyanobacteria bacterium UBA8530]
MKKTLLIAFSLLFALPAQALAAIRTSGWRIDRDLKFHLAFYPSSKFTGEALKYPPLGYNGKFLPDIDNIDLAGFLEMGFPVPTREKPADHRFYLKFYPYPSSLNVGKSTAKIFEPFLLGRTLEKNALKDFLSNSRNVVIKKGYIGKANENFSPEHPFPSLLLPTRPVSLNKETLSPQDYLDRNVPFASLYVEPTEDVPEKATEAQKAAWSSKGVSAAHGELLKLYQKTYIELLGKEGDRFRYFLSESSAAGMTVLKIPRVPLTFPNYRDLPMPQGPDRIFLTGLLLVSKTSYSRLGQAGTDVKVDSEAFSKEFQKAGAQVLEIGS